MNINLVGNNNKDKATILFNEIDKKAAKDVEDYSKKYHKGRELKTDIYYNEKIKNQIYYLSHLNKNDYEYLPFLIENFLFKYENVFLGKTNYDLKECIVKVRDYILDKNPYQILLNIIHSLEEKSGWQELLHLERLCKILKNVIEIKKSERHNLKHYNLYSICLNNISRIEKIKKNLEEGKKKNQILNEKLDYVPIVVDDKPQKIDLPAEQILEKIPSISFPETNKPNNIITELDPKNLDEVGKIIKNSNQNYNQTISQINTFDKNLNKTNSNEFFKIPEFNNNKVEKVLDQTLSFAINQFEGEKERISEPLELNTIEQPITSSIEKNVTINPVVNIGETEQLREELENTKSTFKRSTSSLFDEISKQDLNLGRERELTPEPTPKILKELIHKEEVALPETKRLPEGFFAEPNIPIIKKSIFLGGQFEIKTDDKSIIKLPPQFRTDDPDLKSLCELINEKNDHGWQSVYTQENISIFRKSVPGNPAIMIKTFATLHNFNSYEVYEAIANVDIRKQWDTVFSEFKIIDEIPEEGSEIIYMRIKSPSMFVSDRDFVQKRKKWIKFPDENSICMHFKSVDHPKCKEVKKVIRGNIIISGYFIKTISTSPLKTFLSIISQTDIKGHIPQWLVNTVSQRAPKDWVNNLYKGCEIVRSKRNKI